jgi:hypothetical protein
MHQFYFTGQKLAQSISEKLAIEMVLLPVYLPVECSRCR